MDRKFYTDSFEKMLKDHADEFKMYPSGKPWHGIYNNLHPGRRWPSLAMGIMLLCLLLVVGRLNIEEPNDKFALTLASRLTNSLSGNNGDEQKTISRIQLPGTVNRTKGATSTTEVNRNNETSSIMTRIDDQNDGNETDLVIKSTNSTTENSKTNTTLNFEGVASNSSEVNDYTDEVPGEMATEIFTSEQEALAAKENLKSLIGTPVNFKANDVIDSAKLAELTALAKIKLKRSRISWKFHVAPSLTYRNFKHEENDALPPNFSLAAGPNATTADNSLDHRMAIGFELGSALMYDLTKKTRLKVGMQFNYTGYNIKAYSVHPINSNLMLNNEQGQAYYVSALSSYSSTPGPSPVTLHNQHLQLSIPVGLEFELAQRGNLKLHAGASFMPTYLIVGSSYVTSSNRKNYISESSLLRKWNWSTAVESFVSWKANNSLTLNLGPQFRYQMLSSYGKKYPHSEHLLDFGIKFGVSKSLR